MNDFSEFTKVNCPFIDDILAKYITKTATEDDLAESMLYSLKAGGKRFRPLLMLAVLDFFGTKIDSKCYQVASSLEMIHTYSLIHDDLPAMDDDDLRRGRPTNHKVFGEGLAILAGDALLTDAFGLLSSADISAEKRIQLVSWLAQASGCAGMVAGQVADLAGESKQLTLKELKAIHRRKTGAIIIYAIQAGTLLAERMEFLEQMQIYAEHLGIAFQIKDDILDIEGDEHMLGKTIGKDVKHNKSTYPALLGLAGAKNELYNEINAALASINEIKKQLNIAETTYLDTIALKLLDD